RWRNRSTDGGRRCPLCRLHSIDRRATARDHGGSNTRPRRRLNSLREPCPRPARLHMGPIVSSVFRASAIAVIVSLPVSFDLIEWMFAEAAAEGCYFGVETEESATEDTAAHREKWMYAFPLRVLCDLRGQYSRILETKSRRRSSGGDGILVRLPRRRGLASDACTSNRHPSSNHSRDQPQCGVDNSRAYLLNILLTAGALCCTN